jgi:hypothetical protein
VEVDIVLDENTNLRDSHDLGESLQYVLESVPNGKSASCHDHLSLTGQLADTSSVDRAFVHMDYAEYNFPSHMQQDS